MGDTIWHAALGNHGKNLILENIREVMFENDAQNENDNNRRHVRDNGYLVPAMASLRDRQPPISPVR
jgi:hypothetical protein